MTRVALWCLLLIVAVVASLSAQETNPTKAGVVKIIPTGKGNGTGFIVRLTNDEAYIITASHVVA